MSLTCGFVLFLFVVVSEWAQVSPGPDGVYTNATSCVPAHWVDKSHMYLYIAFYGASVLVLRMGVQWTMKAMKARKQAEEAALKRLLQDARSSSTTGELSQDEVKNAKRRVNRFSRLVFVWVGIAVLVGIATEILSTNYLAKKLTVTQSDAKSDAENFLSPFAAVFQFFEDGLTSASLRCYATAQRLDKHLRRISVLVQLGLAMLWVPASGLKLAYCSSGAPSAASAAAWLALGSPRQWRSSSRFSLSSSLFDKEPHFQ